ncbi:hypothetical protein GH141_05070 [bacterium]|nr:hypothetical protein [bacterium]
MMPPTRSRDKPLSVVNLKNAGLGTIIVVAWPVALSTLLTQLMIIVDAFWIGRLGSVALAAVGVAGSVFWVLVALSQLTNAGTMAFVARFAGANDRSQAQAALFHGLLLAVFLGVILVLAGVPLSRPILALFGASPEVMQVGTPYLAQSFLLSCRSSTFPSAPSPPCKQRATHSLRFSFPRAPTLLTWCSIPC